MRRGPGELAETPVPMLPKRYTACSATEHRTLRATELRVPEDQERDRDEPAAFRFNRELVKRVWESCA